MARNIEVLSAEAADKPGCSAELERFINMQLTHWRAQHPRASDPQVTTRLTSNEYRHIVTLTLEYDERPEED